MNRFALAAAWFAALAVVLLSACSVKPLAPESGDSKWGLDIRWHGHSCVSLVDSVGRTVVIDPFDDTVGYGRLSLLADALLITHSHFDHSFRPAVRARAKDIDIVDSSSGTSTVAAGLVVTGIPSAHDGEGGQVHGQNSFYLFQMGGLRCLHLGDLGTSKLTEFQRKMIGQVDILFVPVGGVTTLGPKQAKHVVDQLRPGAVFPMHHGDIRFYRLESVEKFAALFPAGSVQRPGAGIRVRPTDLTDSPIVYILTPQTRN